MSRLIRLEGIENFRDFGGCNSRSGQSVSGALLYRSGHYAAATAADLERLNTFGIDMVLDLRRPSERRRETCRHDLFARTIISNDADDDRTAWLEALKTADLTADWFRRDRLQFYAQMPFEARHIDLFSRWFRALAASEGAALVHCAAGKDRTGVVCALTQHLLGVHEDDIVADYLSSNEDSQLNRWIAEAASGFELACGKRPKDEALRVGVQVSPEYLQATFDRVTEVCGSIDAYLEEILGVDAALRDCLAAKLLR
ncbi:MAG TPA: tyrosine-protein phosphatase [Phenylobacterium sp.]